MTNELIKFRINWLTRALKDCEDEKEYGRMWDKRARLINMLKEEYA